MPKTISKLVSAAISAAEASTNEAQLRHELEIALKAACDARKIPWTPFQLERALKASGKPTKIVDVAHGAVVIEYEPPKSFSGRVGRNARHSRVQAEEYAVLISAEEGRELKLMTCRCLMCMYGRCLAFSACLSAVHFALFRAVTVRPSRRAGMRLLDAMVPR